MVTQTKTDVKTVQSLLRQADVGTTLDLYTHAINQDKLVAQNQGMEAMMKPGLVNSESGIAARLESTKRFLSPRLRSE